MFSRKKTPPTEKIIRNMAKYASGNTEALNKYKLNNMLRTLVLVDSRLMNNYYRNNNNGTWKTSRNTPLTTKNIKENLGLYGYSRSNIYEMLSNYKEDPKRYASMLKYRLG